MDSFDTRFFVEKRSNLWCVLRKSAITPPRVILAYDDQDQAERVCAELRKRKFQPVEPANLRQAEVRAVFVTMDFMAAKLIDLRAEYSSTKDVLTRQAVGCYELLYEMAEEDAELLGFNNGGIAS